MRCCCAGCCGCWVVGCDAGWEGKGRGLATDVWPGACGRAKDNTPVCPPGCGIGGGNCLPFVKEGPGKGGRVYDIPGASIYRPSRGSAFTVG